MDRTDRKANDVGGLELGRIDRHEHAVTLFDKRVDALVMLLINPPIAAFRMDAVRRAVETNSPEAYVSLGYYEKWLYATRDLLIEQGIVSADELDARMRTLSLTDA